MLDAMGDTMRVCDRIRAAREVAELTVSQCARAMEWSHHKMWTRLEDGERRVELDELTCIAKILGVTVSHLYGEQPILLPHHKKRGRPSGTESRGESSGLGK